MGKRKSLLQYTALVVRAQFWKPKWPQSIPVCCATSIFRLVLDQKKRIRENEKVLVLSNSRRDIVV